MSALTDTGTAHWDESYSTVMRDDDRVHVEVDAVMSDDGSELVVRRTVTLKAYRARDRHIVWMGDVLVVPRAAIAGFVRDLVAELA